MAWYDREEQSKKIVKGLKKLGLTIKHQAKHDAATARTGAKTMIPRHGLVRSKTTASICKFLLANGYEKEDIKRALKWK